mgnify:CR=1 FL=1
MKNIVTALMQFVILVVALIIVTFAIPNIAGNDDRYDKYIAENSKQIVTVGSAFGVVKDGEKASYTDIDNSLKNILSPSQIGRLYTSSFGTHSSVPSLHSVIVPWNSSAV